MKKIISLLLVVAMLTLALASCSKPAGEAKDTSAAAGTTAAPAADATYKLGMGVDVSTKSSKDGSAQVDATVAAVITDANGKIVDCYIDVAQNKMKLTDGAATTGQEYLTKMEKGTDYNMASVSGIGKEWNEQAKFFANYVIGKTVAEVGGIKTVEKDSHMVAEDADILAGCTMQITDMVAAIVKACNDSSAKTFKSEAAPKVSLACATNDSSSKDATDSADGLAAMYTTFGATVVVDGKLAADIIDEIQPKIAFDKAGAIGEITFNGTKRELGDDYGMRKASGISKEWNEQAKTFEEFVVGKTASEISAIEITESNGHKIAVDADLVAGCTMGIDSYIAILTKAIG